MKPHSIATLIGLCAAWHPVLGSGAEAGPVTSIDLTQLPPPVTSPVDFDRDVKPIFEAACLRCHGAESPKGRFSLMTRADALKGGARGVDIIPGKSADSPLIHYVSRLVKKMNMPPAGKPLTTNEIGILRAWIDKGAQWTQPPETNKTDIAATPFFGWTGVSGSAGKFRELYWTKEGWTGGLNQFHIREDMPGGKSVQIDGRAIPIQNDYKVDLKLEQKETGYARFGYSEYRKYFMPSGAEYPANLESPYKFDSDPHLTIGKAWAELGLNKPDWPKITLGYEYQFKKGDKTSLEWGPVSSALSTDPAYDPHMIYPSLKSLDEQTHILRLDASHDIRGFFVADNLRIEFYDQANSRLNAVEYQSGPGGLAKFVEIKDGYNHFQAANSIRVEKQWKDWLFTSAGYLYSHLQGDAGYGLNTILPPVSVPTPSGWSYGSYWFSQSIQLDQDSHVFNANLMLGQWDGLTISTGVQNEWMIQRGVGNISLDEGDTLTPGLYFVQPAKVDSNISRFGSDENLAIRYTKIPWTTLFFDGRFRQETMGQFEEEAGYRDFMRQTDSNSDTKEYRAGFTVSPWTQLALTAHYKWRDKHTDYDHVSVLPDPSVSPGYPAFLKYRQNVTDEVELKLVYKPVTWFKTTLSYQLDTTDYRAGTIGAAFGPLVITPGGQTYAGNYDANVYSALFTLTPWRRLNLTYGLTYRDSETVTVQNDTTGVAPWKGGVYTLLHNATYVLTEKTDLFGNFNYSRADFAQNPPSGGVPYGYLYDWYGAGAGIRWHATKNLTTQLQYGFYRYDERTSNNFTAHAVFASLNMALP